MLADCLARPTAMLRDAKTGTLYIAELLTGRIVPWISGRSGSRAFPGCVRARQSHAPALRRTAHRPFEMTESGLAAIYAAVESQLRYVARLDGRRS